MPKTKCESLRLRDYVKEFGEEYFSTNRKIIFCKVCKIRATSVKRFHVQQHCDTAKHKTNINRQSAHQSRQLFLLDTAKGSTSSKSSEFSKDLCEMMVSANIPLNKVNYENFKKCMEKYTTQPIPNESTLRKNYLPSCYESALRKIKNSVGNNKIWVSIDESTDSCGRYVVNIVIGTLFADRPGDIFFLDSVNQQLRYSLITP